MANTFNSMVRMPPSGMSRVVVGKKPENQNKTGVDVTVALFFDGTNNNRNNVAQRRIAHYNKQHPSAPVYEEDGVRWTGSYAKNATADNSYSGGYSNVSILEQLNRKRALTKKEISIYIEGIGTLNDQGDATRGSAFGSGSTGITAKVNLGVLRLASAIGAILRKERNIFIKSITIDVFGFSRGAAAARHFVYVVQHSRVPMPVALGAPQATIKIKFVGIFDTVSSFGIGIGFGSNVKELGLALGSVPQKLVHLTAGDECRENFSLTDITSSMGVGYQLTLPGVHSDVGGGYAEQEDEVRKLGLNQRKQLIAQGWYTPTQLKEVIEYVPNYSPYGMAPPTAIPYLQGSRRGVRWDYQFIPLRLMATYAQKFGMSLQPLQPGSRFGKYALAPNHPLAPAQAAIESAANKHGISGKHALALEQLGLSLPQIHLVRNRFLHRSASDKLGMGARYVNGRPQRQIFPG